MIYETTTTLSGAEVIARAKRFFAERVPQLAVLPEGTAHCQVPPATPVNDCVTLAPVTPWLLWFVTVLALCTGLTAVRFGIQGRWELAVTAIIIAAVLDSLDGRLARRMGATTKFGAAPDTTLTASSSSAWPRAGAPSM